MSSHDHGPDRRRVLAALGLGLLTGGCFTPLYADRGTEAGGSVRGAMSQVDVGEIPGRVGLEVRNALIFELSGGAGNPTGAVYRLETVVNEAIQIATIDTTTRRAQNEIITVTASYRLRERSTDKIVVTDQAFAKVTIDRANQLFARDRAIRDAQNRAAKVVAEQMRSRIASFFVAGA